MDDLWRMYGRRVPNTDVPLCIVSEAGAPGIMVTAPQGCVSGDAGPGLAHLRLTAGGCTQPPFCFGIKMGLIPSTLHSCSQNDTLLSLIIIISVFPQVF